MNTEQELQQLEQWFRQFEDPQVPPELLSNIREQIRVEASANHLQSYSNPQVSEALKSRIKQAVHDELKDGPHALIKIGTWMSRNPWLFAAAMLVLVCGANLLMIIRPEVESTRQLAMANDFEISFASMPGLDDIETDLEAMEVKSYVDDYLTMYDEHDPDEFVDDLERLTVPDYMIHIEPTLEGV